MTEATTTSVPGRLSRPGRPDVGAADACAAELFAEHRRMVLGVCRMLLRNPHDAEDATQQTFLYAYRSMLAGTAPRQPAAWLATIARNECRARIRSRMREPLHEAPDGASELPDPLTAAIRNADLAALWRAIGELPRLQRDALLLREFSGLSYEELAAALAVSGPAVESLLFRARRDLRRRLRGLPPASLAPAAAMRAVFDWVAAISVPAKVVAGAAAVSVAAGGTALTIDPHMVGSAASGRRASPAGENFGPRSANGGRRAEVAALSAPANGAGASSSASSLHEAASSRRSPNDAGSSEVSTHDHAEQAAASSGGGDDDSSSGTGSAGVPSDEGPSPGSGEEEPPAGGGGPGSGGSGSSPSDEGDPPVTAPAPGDDDGDSGSESSSAGPSDSSEVDEHGGDSDEDESEESDARDEDESPESAAAVGF